MTWFGNLSIRSKLLTAFAAVLFLTLLVSIAAITSARRMQAALADISDVQEPMLVAALTATADMNGIARDLRQGMLVTGVAANAAWKKSFDDQVANLEAQRRVLTELMQAPEQRAQLAKLEAAWNRWHEGTKEVVTLASTDKNAEANAILQGAEYRGEIEALQAALHATEQLSLQATRSAITAAEQTGKRLSLLIVVLAVLALVLGAVIAYWIASHMAKRLQRVIEGQRSLSEFCIAGLRSGIGALAVGDLTPKLQARTQPVDDPLRDEIGSLVKTFNVMLSDVQGMVSDFGHAQQSVAKLVQEVERLAAAGREGRLGVRGEAAQFQGSYAALVTGLNGVLDSIVTPVNETIGVLERVAAGDFTRQVRGAYHGDHARMQAALNTAIDEMRTAIRGITANVAVLTTSSEGMTGTAREMGAAAEQTSEQAGSVSAATEEVATNLSTIASATEQIAASIGEIAKSASAAAGVATRGVTVAAGASETIVALGNASNEISQVTQMIATIAGQTNLLALNATIEAARAGESGKGFAVVAEEVKELARQSANATEEIGRKIDTIQRQAASAVAAMQEITSIVHQVSDLQTTIASAVEEQTATAHEMSRNVSQAATGGQEIARNITLVSDAAQEASRGVQQTRDAAERLAELATDLHALVDRFQLGDDQPSAARRTARRREGVLSVA